MERPDMNPDRTIDVPVNAWHELKTIDAAGTTHVLLGAEVDYTGGPQPQVLYVDLTVTSTGIQRCSLESWKKLPDLTR